MKRKDFIKKGLLGGAGILATNSILSAQKISVQKNAGQVGFNHLPNKEIKTMKSILHKANTRGYANHGWLEARHSFSFANYYNPERMQFGALRVLNDDRIEGGKGFGTHPHDNMEIITIPLEGELEHKDSMDNVGVIRNGEIQVMSAGKGIYHSEYNKNKDSEVKLLQIWIFPNKKNVEPRYDQIVLKDIFKQNTFNQILSPSPDDEGVWIHQNSWFHLGHFENKQKASYDLNDANNGIYAFIIEGKAVIGGQELEKRDGFGVWDTKKINIEISEKSKILLLEVPMIS
jgi:hypothetical protein